MIGKLNVGPNWTLWRAIALVGLGALATMWMKRSGRG